MAAQPRPADGVLAAWSWLAAWVNITARIGATSKPSWTPLDNIQGGNARETGYLRLVYSSGLTAPLVDLELTPRKIARPYVMRGPARPTARRPTIADPPDRRLQATPVHQIRPDELRIAVSRTRGDPRLRAVDRLFERWAVTKGDGAHFPLLARSEALYRSSSSRPPPLEDAESRVVDAVFRSAPSWARHFIKLWYRAQATAEEIQSVLAIKRRSSVYEERERVLFYFLGGIIQAGMQLDPLGLDE
jgi:hypothetical protein